MTFFYDINKKLAAITDKPEPTTLNEGAAMKAVKSGHSQRATEDEIPKHLQGAKKSDIPAYKRNPVGQQPRTPLTLQDLEAERDRNISSSETLRKIAQGEPRGVTKEGNDGNLANNAKPYDKVTRGDVIAGRLGKDAMGGKAKRVKEADMDESALQAYLGKKKYGAQGMKALQQAGREGASKEKMAKIRAQHDKMDEGWEDMVKDVEKRAGERKVGDIQRGHKHDIKHTATGRIVTRRTDDQGISVGADDDTPADAPKRGRGRPKGSKKAMGAKGPSGKSKLMAKEGFDDLHDQGEYDREGEMAKEQLSTAREAAAELQSILDSDENLPEWVQSKITKAVDYLDTARDYMDAKDDQPVTEKAVSRNQAVAARIARGVQKGEVKAEPGSASAEMAKMEPKELKKFAKTDTKGLPKKVKAKEEVEETADDTPKAKKGGFQYGKGIYDSMNRELETMIAESMNLSMSMNNDSHGGPSKTLTVTATDEDADLLGKLLKMAGVGGGAEGGCGGNPAQQVDENSPDWPTNTETSRDALQYAGGINKPKTDVAGDGQTTVPVTAVRVQEEDDLARMMEMAGMPPKTEGVLGTLGGAALGSMLGGPVGAAVGAVGGHEMTKGGSSIVEAGKGFDSPEQETKVRARLRELEDVDPDNMYKIVADEFDMTEDDLRAALHDEVNEEQTDEGNRFAWNVLKAKQAGKTEADLDGDGDLEKIRESMNRLWHAYKV